MGGTGLYHPPVDAWTSISSWADHTNRSTPSTEPGVDWRCPIGTPVYAAASGVIYETGYDLDFAGGRFVAIDLDDGHRARYLHLSRIDVTPGQRVAWGQAIGLSGATGYGVEDWSADPSTGGAHVHETIFPGHAYVFGRYATLDPWPLTDTDTPEDDDMFSDTDRSDLRTVKTMLEQRGFGGILPVKFGQHLMLMGQGFIKHFGWNGQIGNIPGGWADYQKNLLSENDVWADLNVDAFLNQLDALGIPRGAVKTDAVASTFAILNPETGKYERGGFWSYERANNRLLHDILAATKK